MMPRNILIYATVVIAPAALAIAGLSTTVADSIPAGQATTPIKHVVVIFEENATFDHYFGTYPHAVNPPGEPRFVARPGTPAVNGLSETLLLDNPNAADPQRLDRAQPLTCDQDHHYKAEQQAYDGGLVDQFVQHTAGSECTGAEPGPTGQNKTTVMDYYDGNTVTALWNYAQHYTLEENSFGTQFGPSSPGHLNLVSGETGGASATKPNSSLANGSLIGNAYPQYDDCVGDGNKPGGVSEPALISMSGRNVGNLLNAGSVSWGWFQGGFTPTGMNAEGRAECRTSHDNVGAQKSYSDYVSYHEPFQYYASTANPHHLPPTSVGAVGESDRANHQYDLSYFNGALAEGNLPAVSFLKPAAYEDGHPGYSDPLDEQRYLVDTINAIERSPQWSSTAVIVSWDDSDGWYDHVMPPIVRSSASPQDNLDGPEKCGTLPSPLPPSFQQDRCGYGPRLPLLVISPWARENYVDNTLTDQSSILRFIEDNWQLGRIGGNSSDAEAGSLESAFDFNPSDLRAATVMLDDTTGEVLPPARPGEPPSSTAGPGAPPPTVTGRRGPARAVGCSLSLEKHHRRRLAVTCRFTAIGIHGRAAVRMRLVRRGRVLATARAFLHDSQATTILRLERIPKGSYTLRIVLTSRAAVLGFVRSVRVG
ncbi:MAG TPA: alkaline phosphatase family protein [Solirubrobacteraceae bacterium]|jgi:phospholipase C